MNLHIKAMTDSFFHRGNARFFYGWLFHRYLNKSKSISCVKMASRIDIRKALTTKVLPYVKIANRFSVVSKLSVVTCFFYKSDFINSDEDKAATL